MQGPAIDIVPPSTPAARSSPAKSLVCTGAFVIALDAPADPFEGAVDFLVALAAAANAGAGVVLEIGEGATVCGEAIRLAAGSPAQVHCYLL